MNSTTSRFSKALRGTAVAVFLAGAAVWVASGARLGWTQTSTVDLQRDEITGIEFPVRRAAFIAGIEVPAIATAAALALAGVTLLPRRRTVRVAA